MLPCWQAWLVLHLQVISHYMKPATDYKVLFEDCAQQGADKDRLIVLLQQQLTQLAGARQILSGVIDEQQEQLKNQAMQIAGQ